MKLIRFLIRFVISIAIVVVVLSLGLYISGNGHVVKAVRSTYLQGKTGPTIDDYTKFDNRIVAAGNSYAFDKATQYNQYELSSPLLEESEAMESIALLVLKNGELWYEKYWNDYSETSKTNSFSMAKSFTSLCIGAAIQEGKIKSVHQKVGDFLPEFKSGEKAKIRIKDLLTMSSGIDFGESYGDPFGFMAQTYYGADLYELSVNKPIQYKAGEKLAISGRKYLIAFIYY